MGVARALALMLVGGVLVGCADVAERAAPTQLVVAVDSDYEVGQELVRVLLETERHDGVRRNESLRLTSTPREERETDVPFSFGVPAREHDIGRDIVITVTGYGPNEDALRVRHQVRTGFLKDKSLLLAIGLSRDCEQRFAKCEAMQERCVDDGPCVPAAVDPASLRVVEPGRELDEFSLYDGKLRPKDGGSRDAEVPFPFSDAGTDRQAPDAPPPACAAPPCDSGAPACDGDRCGEADCESGACGPGDADVCRDGSCVDSGKRCEGGACEEDSGHRDSAAAEAGCDETACGEPGCTPEAERCAGGALDRCDDDGRWRASETCYSGCDDSVQAGCSSCESGERACAQHALLTCSSDGKADVDACHFGCWDEVVDCRERTAVGQALITTLL